MVFLRNQLLILLISLFSLFSVSLISVFLSFNFFCYSVLSSLFFFSVVKVEVEVIGLKLFPFLSFSLSFSLSSILTLFLSFLFFPFLPSFFSFFRLLVHSSFFFLGLHMQHMEVPRPGAESELQLLAYATATAPSDPSHVCSLRHGS